MCSSIQAIVGPLSPDSPDIKKSRRVDMTLSTRLDFLISGLSGDGRPNIALKELHFFLFGI